MSFDKIKAMRNAERFLAQGKIRAAINEYRRISESDPKDFSTLNMLGDLHAKASDTAEAVRCFNRVAEHYTKQGFFQKAIAIYNKVLRLQPDSWEVSAKLAQLYQNKGLIAEARSHYTVVADQYQRKGKKDETLSVWKQIAELDPENTEIHLKIADFCRDESRSDEAAESYIEAGSRLLDKKRYEPAAAAFSRALDIKPDQLLALKGFVNAHIQLGSPDAALETLEDILEKQPYNREVIYLLVDCYLEMDNPAAAEKAVIQLVEKEPTSYPKFLELAPVYLKNNDLESAARILLMSSEHMLVGGQAKELEKWVNEILARNPEQIEALRLLIRLHGWQRDEAELKTGLERLAAAANAVESVEDERYALSQLILIAPHEVEYAKRLQEINVLYGNSDVEYESPLLPDDLPIDVVPVFESFALLDDAEEDGASPMTDFAEYEEPAAGLTLTNGNGTHAPETNRKNGSSNGRKGFQFDDEAVFPTVEEDAPKAASDFALPAVETAENEAPRELSAFEENNLRQEIEGVEFYVAQGYQDLAEKSLESLEEQFGKRTEIDNLRASLNSAPTISFDDETIAEASPVEFGSPAISGGNGFDLVNEFKEELDSEESNALEGDYETHYHLGIAYKEMGLLEDSIREFQDAVKFVSAADGTRRFLLCCNLLGHCFMEKQMPSLALMWFKRGLGADKITAEERQGLNYEIANAYELGGETEKAAEFFGEIYAVNVDFRDVGERLKTLQAQ